MKLSGEYSNRKLNIYAVPLLLGGYIHLVNTKFKGETKIDLHTDLTEIINYDFNLEYYNITNTRIIFKANGTYSFTRELFNDVLIRIEEIKSTVKNKQ